MKHAAITMTVMICLALTGQAGAVGLEFVPVVPSGNAGESSGYGGINGIVGGVAYDYQIGKYEVTAGQYADFLNAKAASDPYGLFNASMGIVQSGTSGSFTYATATPNLPVNYVSWGDAARFANWINNGQGAGDTETGAYTLNGAVTAAALAAVTRNGGASKFIASEDEWYKAAFYNPGSSTYVDYATSTDTTPTAEAPAGGANSANYANAVGGLTDVGAYTASVSFYGTFDQSGNVEEWTDTSVDVSGTLYHVYRGGGFDDSAFSVQSMGRTGATDRTDERASLGFRMSTTTVVSAGDFDGDSDVDADDIDLLCANLGDVTFDLDGDSDSDEDDLIYLVQNLVELTDGSGRTGTDVGDFNLDGLINATDLAIMNPNFGLTGLGYASGNANCDTFINATDLAILAANFGYVAPAGSVPEPITVSLLGLGGLAMLRRKRN